MHKSDWSLGTVSKLLGVPRASVQTIVHIYKHFASQNNTETGSRSGFSSRHYFNWQVSRAGAGILQNKQLPNSGRQERRGRMILISRQNYVVKNSVVRTGWNRQKKHEKTDFSVDRHKHRLNLAIEPVLVGLE